MKQNADVGFEIKDRSYPDCEVFFCYGVMGVESKHTLLSAKRRLRGIQVIKRLILENNLRSQ